jgi:minor curlin subunit
MTALGLGTGTTAFCQQVGKSEAATAEQRLAEDVGADWRNLPASFLGNLQNLSEVVQKGNSNKAITLQNNPSNVVNQAYILQVGSFNEASVAQNGSGNTTRVQQHGSDNQVVSSVNGNDNITNLNQSGFGNRIVRDVTTDGADVKLTQTGNGNALTQRGTESMAPPAYEVEMRGNGIKLTIEQGRVGQ